MLVLTQKYQWTPWWCQRVTEESSCIYFPVFRHFRLPSLPSSPSGPAPTSWLRWPSASSKVGQLFWIEPLICSIGHLFLFWFTPLFFQIASSSNLLETDVWQIRFLFKSNFLYPDAWKFGWVRITCWNLLPLRPLRFLLASSDDSWEDCCISISYFFVDRFLLKAIGKPSYDLTILWSIWMQVSLHSSHWSKGWRVSHERVSPAQGTLLRHSFKFLS